MKRTLATLLFLFVAVASAQAHDMFLKLDSFFLQPHATAPIALINGTFAASENTITRDRMRDVLVVGPVDETFHPEHSAWTDRDLTSYLNWTSGGPGTYAIGVSTAPNMIELTADEFNEYLEHDGVLDVLEARRASGKLDKPAAERYSKHVKALVQVSEARSAAFAAELGYPAEIVPLANPYELGAGDTLELRILVHGKPVAGQLVYAGYDGFEPHDEGGHHHREAIHTESDADGLIRLALSEPGRWYVRYIHMVPVDEPGVDYESTWATLTFEIR